MVWVMWTGIDAPEMLLRRRFGWAWWDREHAIKNEQPRVAPAWLKGWKEWG